VAESSYTEYISGRLLRPVKLLAACRPSLAAGFFVFCRFFLDDSDFSKAYSGADAERVLDAIRERLWALARFRCPLEFVMVSANGAIYFHGPTRGEYAELFKGAPPM